MKKIIIIIGLIFLIAFTPTDTEVKYNVSLSLQDWQHKLDIIEVAKNALRQSDLPSKISFPLIDSLSTIQNEFKTQIVPQLPKSTQLPKSKPPVDSTKLK